MTRRPDPAALDTSYSAAVYRTRFAEREIAFTFGATTHRTDTSISPQTPWAVLTAFNPRSNPLSADDNQRRWSELHATLRAARYRTAPSESSDLHGNHREPGFLIFDIERSALLALAHRFDQRAAVFADRGKVGLLFTATERWVVLSLVPYPDRGPGASPSPPGGA